MSLESVAVGRSRRISRRVMGVVAAFAIGVAGAAVGAQAANAYVWGGCKWNTNNIVISDSIGSPYAASYTQSRSRWSLDSDVNLSGGSGSPFTAATTYNTGDPGITQSQCSLLGFYNFTHVYGNTYYLAGYVDQKRRTVWTHELGHAFGLEHTSSTAAIMYPSMAIYTTYGLYTPQTDDINGVNANY